MLSFYHQHFSRTTDNTYDYSLTGIKDIAYEFNKYDDSQSFSTEIFLFFHNQYIIDNLKKTDFYASFSLFLESDILTPINITAYDYILLSKEGACFLVEEDGTNEGDGFIFYSKIEITKEKAFEYLLISPSTSAQRSFQLCWFVTTLSKSLHRAKQATLSK